MPEATNNNVDGQQGNEGTGGGSLLTSSGGGGTGASSKGDGDSGNVSTAKKEATGDSSASNSTKGGTNTDWKSSLPKEIQEEPSLKLFNDVSALAKSYISAQKLIGADKIAIPSKHATDDDWMGVYKKLGLPDDIKEYDVKLAESVSLDKEFVEKFKETAHKAGILPKQAQMLADWFSKTNLDAETRISNEHKANQTKNIEALKTEWGEAFDGKINKAQQVLREVANPDINKYLEETGLGNDVNLIKLFATIGDKFLAEGKDISTKGAANAMTPKEAMSEYNKIMADMSHPYWTKDHPNHKNALAEVANLFKMATPIKK